MAKRVRSGRFWLWFAAAYAHSAVRYLFIGGLSFAIDFGTLTLLYKIFVLPLWLATGTAFLSSFVFSYLAQRAFSFSSNAPHSTTLVKYLLLLGFNTLATIGIVGVIDRTELGWGAGKVAATLITTSWNYFAFKYWVFPSSREDEAATSPQPAP